MTWFVGLDVGGTKSAVCLADENASPIDREEFPTEPLRGADAVIGRYIDAVGHILRRNHLAPEDLTAVGIGCGGPLDSKQGLLLSPPNLPGWNRVPIVSMLEKATGAPTFLQNDANACALAEWRHGAGRGVDNMIFLTFGTGFGAGLILNGKIYEGASGLAGEIGHVRLSEEGPVGYGKVGSVEGFCSGGGIAQLAARELLRQRQLGRRPALADQSGHVTAKTVCDAAREEDPVAIEILAECGRRLGKTLAILVDLLNPERIVIGSIYARAEAFLLPHARSVMEEECLEKALEVCTIVPAALGERLGDVAAVSTAVYGCENRAADEGIINREGVSRHDSQ